MPDDEPLEVTEPTDVVAWLRALPVGTVLLAEGAHGMPRAWQVRPLWDERRSGLMLAGSEEVYQVADDDDMSVVAGEGPFRVLWTPGGGS